MGGILSPVLPAGSACRCLESSSTASTASTTGPLWSDIADPTFGTNPAAGWERCRIGASIWIFIHGSGSIWDLPSTDFPGSLLAPSAIRQPRPLLGELLIWKASSWPSGMTDCTTRTFETSSADLDATCHTEPSTGSAASASAKTDSVSTTDQSQQTMAPDPGPEGQGTQ